MDVAVLIKVSKALGIILHAEVQHRYDVDALLGVHGATVLANGTTVMSTTTGESSQYYNRHHHSCS